MPDLSPDEISRDPTASRLLDGIRAVVFDLDGTLVDSRYDWPAIRRELGVDRASIIDTLNGLASPEREAKWERLQAIERRASEEATLREGAAELLGLLRRQRLKTALVTNNTAENAALLVRRFGLGFDLVLTRDDGLWKPSGAPVAEAIRRLGVAPSECLKVGDSRYDVAAGRAAGCRRIVLVRDHPELSGEVDLAFPDIPAFLRYLRAALPGQEVGWGLEDRS